MNKYKVNKWIKPGLYTTLDKFSVVSLGFISFFLLTRVLTKTEFGVWVLFTGIVSILETLREGFVKQPFIAFLAAAKNQDRTNLGSAAFIINLIYSILVSLVLLALAYPLELFWGASPLGNLLRIYALSNLVFVPFSHFEYLQQARLDFKGIFLSHLIRSIVPTTFILFMASIKLEFSLNSLAIVSLVGNVIGTGTCIYFGFTYRHPLKKPTWTSVRYMLGFGKYSLGTNFGALTVRNMDSWMLGKMLSTESVAQYNPAIRISNLVEIPTLTIANLVFPKMAQSYDGSDYKASSELYERSLGVLLGIMIPIAFFMFFFSDWIVLIVAGKNYMESGYLLKITAFYVLFIPFGRQFGVLLDAVRKPKVNFYFVIGTAILNVVISYLFIARWGIAGAAFGTLITYVIRFIFQQVILYKVFGIFTSRIFPNVLRFYSDVFAMIRPTRSSK